MAIFRFYCGGHPDQELLIDGDTPRVNMISEVLGDGTLKDFDEVGFEMSMADTELPDMVRCINRNIRALLTEGGYRHRKSIGHGFDFEGARHFLQPEIYSTDKLITILIALRKLARFCIENNSPLLIEEHTA